MASFTDKEILKAIRDAKKNAADVWITDAEKTRGVGRLRLRAMPTGRAVFYFRYTDSNGIRDQIALGSYDEKGKDGLTLKDAGAKFAEHSKLYQSGKTDLRAYLEHQDAEEKARMETAARARAEAERQAISGSFQKMLDGYIAHLKRQGKQAEQDARNIFRRNVNEEFPHLAFMRASDITLQDISAILSKLIDRGAGRTAAKLRAYLRAAFAAALSAESEPTAHPDLHGFHLTSNPAAAVSAKKLSAFNRPRERVLNEAEMRAFLVELEKQSGVARDAILLTLYLGGQRSAQLVRLKPGDVDLPARELTLYDGKGARTTPRIHLLPITERAAEVVGRLFEVNGDKTFLISLAPRGKNKDGAVHVRTETLADVVTQISKAMVEAKSARESFELRDLRRTCETMMARMGISKDIRAHILSHGLGGVQARHYDKHDYLDEKRRALESWDAELERIKSGTASEKVIPIAKGKIGQK